MTEMKYDTALFSDSQQVEFLEGWKNAGGCTKALNESSKLLSHPWEYKPQIMAPKNLTPYDLGWAYWEKIKKDAKNKSAKSKKKKDQGQAKIKEIHVMWPFGVWDKIQQWAETENLPLPAYARKIFLDAMTAPASLLDLIKETTVPINQGTLCDSRALYLPDDKFSKFRQYVDDYAQLSHIEIMRAIYIDWLDRKEVSNL